MSVQPVTGRLRPEDVDVVLRGDMPLGVHEYAAEKVAHVSRLSRRPVRTAHVVVTHHADPALAEPFRVEVTMDVARRLVRAVADGARPREAIDVVVERLERQVVAVGDRWQQRSRWLGLPHTGRWRHGTRPSERPATVPRPAEEREVVRRKSFAVGRETLDEAAFDMEALGHDFFLFVDDASGRDVLLHRRDDGAYGVIGLAEGVRLPPGVVHEPGPATLNETGARHRLDDGGEPFVFYTDLETRRGHVAYRRRDGHYGVITPAGRR
ncbi:MAG: HPF/RaiA family ribosome-associated protein [Actinomycetes bacterium]